MRSDAVIAMVRHVRGQLTTSNKLRVHGAFERDVLIRQQVDDLAFEDEEADTLEWIITIYMYMEPDYSDIVDIEEWFTKIAVQHGGEYDGWGCMAYVYDDEDMEDELKS